jgi:UPF0042 nucleotide-binding protein
MRVIIVSGLSGAGKSVALHMLEDLGCYCIDNLPATLLMQFVDHAFQSGDAAYTRTAIGIDARNHRDQIAAVPDMVRRIREMGIDCTLLFLRASEEALIKRYSETRRRHPLSGQGFGLRSALEHEQEVMLPISEVADLVVDTSRKNVHQLRELIRDHVDRRESQRLSLLFQSFAFKHGVPSDADFVFDVRALPNPHWHTALRPLTGLDEAVADFLAAQPSVNDMVADIERFLERWIPEFERTNRSYLTVAIGCTGGQHRSVYIASTLARRFTDRYTNVLTQHRELPG